MRATLLAALILCATVTVASAYDPPTDAEKEACKPDAFKLCWRHFLDEDVYNHVFNCLRNHRVELSTECRFVFLKRRL